MGANTVGISDQIALEQASPLPQRYFSGGPGVGGILKERPEDFLVEEIPLYEPCGEGEHLYLCIQKKGVSHGELMSVLRRSFQVGDRAIGYAGMKDKQAITQQVVSIHLPGRAGIPESMEMNHERVQVLWADRHRNKLRRGHLKGNRFSIRIREVDPLRAPLVRDRLAWLEQHGVPNYFGEQRFGYRVNNHRLGRFIMGEAWEAALGELLGTGGSPFPEHQRERRELFEEKRFEEAVALWTPADRAELMAIKALRRGATAKKSVAACGKTIIRFWGNALQSAVFNRVLDERLERGALEKLGEGDLAWRHDNRSVFSVTAEELSSDALAIRLADREISPSGPLWGEGMTRASGEVGERELAVLDSLVQLGNEIDSQNHNPEGRRRALRTILTNPMLESGVDEHGAFIRVAFDLPRGSYATVVLREIMKNERPE